MRRYWVEKECFKESFVILEKDDFHHICEVCRQSLNDKFEILQGGTAYSVELVRVDKKKAFAQILSERILPELPKPWIRLCISMSKFATMDLIVEKAVELGVSSVHPFVSDFSFVRQLNDPKIKNKIERWERIAKSATQQTGRGNIMKIENTEKLTTILEKMNQKSHVMGLFPYEGLSDKTAPQALADIKLKAPEEIWVFVGSEGGFSPQEVQLFQAQNIPSMTLGEQVLRVETACIAILSILKYEFTLSKN